MTFGALLATTPLLILMASGDLDRDTEKQFEKIADVVAMAQTCRQHDFEVDDAGINGWSDRAVELAVTQGMERADARARLDQEIAREYEYVQEQFNTAQRMSHSRDHVVRFNRRMKRTCERLADDDMAGAYFTEVDT
ncbi:hypothetical protein [Erythrobacter sp. Alg231-14]|uniref:hypothetical protein n=1 Tax=Erythrobacter sp. Alg231-14 TaxID=1922225 RepID=UPI00307BDB54